MYAIVKDGKGKYYTSAVFGHFCFITATDDYEQYRQRWHNDYYLVLNRDKKRLIKQYVYDWNNKYLEPSVLIVDTEHDDWEIDEEGHGCIRFLKNIDQDRIEEDLHQDITDRCIKMDEESTYVEYPEIKSQKDIDDLLCVSGWFHDACIEKLEEQEDGSLYLLFEGVWGCSIEVWLSGNVTYCATCRSKEDGNAWWYDCTLQFVDDYIFFVDEEGMQPSEVDDNYCWFKAQNMKYHVIPSV